LQGEQYLGNLSSKNALPCQPLRLNIAATEGCNEIIWVKNFLLELGYEQEKYVLRCDSQSAIHLAKNTTFHSCSKHIDVRYYWIREVLEDKLLQLEKVHTDEKWSDMMTKVLSTKKFENCRKCAV